MLRRLIGAAIVAALAAMSGGAYADAGVHSGGSTLGWRVNAVITRAKLATLLTVDAISKRDAWAGGCAATYVKPPGAGGPAPTLPLIEHFNGKSWSRSASPARLHGCIRFIRSSSPANVWAFGWNETAHFSFSAFALHFVRGHWTIAHRWGNKIVGNGLPTGAAVLGWSSIWVFFEDNLIKHYNGHSWLTTSVPGEQFIGNASTDPGGGVWVLGEFSEMAYHMRVIDGVAHWLVTSFASAFPVSPDMNGIYARTPADVWVVGSIQAQSGFRPAMAHYTAGGWHRVKLGGVMALGGATSDGPGELWLRRDWDNTGTPPGIERYSGGVLTPVRMPVRGKQRVGILDIAAIPGTGAAWAVGAFLNNGALGASTAVIMRNGS